MKSIPKTIQDELFFAFESVYTQTRLEKIAERYGFTEKLDEFRKIVEETLYGNRSIRELSKTLQEEIGVSAEVAQYIEIELDQELFSTRRLEFNVAQGFVSPDEITLTEEPGNTEEKTLQAEQPETKQKDDQPPLSTKDSNDTASQKDPIAGSILNNQKPASKSDPYREPIDEQ